MSATSFEANLHSLVDDEIDDRRRADTLAKLTLSPADTEKLASWRRQNQLLRAAFAGIEAEAVPLSLSLVTPPRVVTWPLAEPQAIARHSASRRFAAALACGLGGIAIFALALWPLHVPPALDATPVATIASTPDVSSLVRRTNIAATSAGSRRITLPDLGRAGLVLSSADVFNDTPAPVACGTYAGGGHRHVVLCAERTSGDTWPPADPRVWRRGETIYALAGDLGDATPTLAAQIRAAMDAADPQ